MKSPSSPFHLARILGPAILTVLLLLPGLAMAQKKDVTTWRVQSHWPAASSSYTDSLLKLRDILIERTDGRLVLEPYEAGSLFSATESFNAVRRGIIPMATTSPAYLIDQVPLAGVAIGQPFAFRNVWEAAYFHQQMGFEQMMRDQVAKYGVYYSTDRIFPTEMVVSRPIESLNDFKKLKIRSAGVLQVFLTDAGASASYIAAPELYTALSQGIVDGAHWGAAVGAMSMSLYEVIKYHVKPALTISGSDAFIINQKAMDKLPEDVREILLDTMNEQFWKRTNEYLYDETITLANAQKDLDVKVNVLPQEVQDHMVQAAQKSWDKEAKRSKESAEAIEMMKEFLGRLGYL